MPEPAIVSRAGSHRVLGQATPAPMTKPRLEGSQSNSPGFAVQAAPSAFSDQVSTPRSDKVAGRNRLRRLQRLR